MGQETITVIEPGLLTTVQDLGRRGYQRYGIPVCGALDPVSLRIANILVGNAEGMAGLEVTALGPSLRFESDCVIAVTGAEFELRLDSEPIPCWESVRISAGSTLRIGGAHDGLRCYVAVAGGIEVPEVMDSRSTDLKGGFGGLNGRALRPGDTLSTGRSTVVDEWAAKSLPTSISRETTYGQSFRIRVVLGPQDGMFSEPGIAVLLTSEYTVSVETDRMGCRLEGSPIEHVDGADIVSDGTALGSVQVPGNGTPIVLLADRGTTGGYTKVATVISPDIGLLAQAMPGAKVRFAAVSVEEAHAALIDQEEIIREIKAFVGLDRTGTFSVEVDGVESAVRDSKGGAISVSSVRGPNRTKRRVSAKVGGEEFEFDLDISRL